MECCFIGEFVGASRWWLKSVSSAIFAILSIFLWFCIFELVTPLVLLLSLLGVRD
ncbi:hypothetical protein HMPREF9997_00564 [Corynebacterium durum F0235]|uniref:Uncharacterized protein n=1 Tax=Corynebacterium durum F0235 TaxID=1035195 RepID=L1MKK6_9CORY|nr:hypothetical protein HMPREF9997_00564 [Corynebacterium durum F0235]